MSQVAVPGGVITVNVGPTDATVEVGLSGSGVAKSYDVAGNKDTTLPVPPGAPPGTTIIVRVGKGKRMRRIVVTIVAPTP